MALSIEYTKVHVAVQCRRLCRLPFAGHRVLSGQDGQGTVEYAVVFAAFMAIVVAFGTIWHFLDVGTVVQHALQCASHHLQQVAAGAIGDVFQY